MRIFFNIVLFVVLSHTAFAQEDKAIILKGPTDWRYEKIAFPLDFAPDINYKGFEELRFAPEMFSKGKAYYFTYVFVIVLEDKKTITTEEIDDFLTQYYRGLCKVVADSKKMKVDLSKINIETTKHEDQIHAQIQFLDAFTDGEKIALQMEIDIVKKNSDLVLVSLVSPQTKQSEVWHKLHQIKESIKL